MKLSIKELAELYSITPRAIRKKIKNNEFDMVEQVQGKGGKSGVSYLIPLESLPQEMIDKYNGIEAEISKEELKSFTTKQKDEAYYKRNVIEQFERYCSKNEGMTAKAENFIKEYNEKNPDANLKLCSLYSWRKKWNKRRSIIDLIDTRGGKNKGECTISDEYWNYFYSLYMTQQKRSVQYCYDETFKKFNLDGTKEFPSYSAFKRKADSIPDAAIIKYRYGEKAYKDDVLPYLCRTTKGLESNQIWQSDHHLCDVLVRDENNNPTRLWLTAWIDIKSRVLVGAYLRNGNPNTDTVLHCLHLAVQKTGYKPLQLYTDNGKDYKSKRGLRMDIPDSLANRLGVEKVINAIAYNAQAKLIERFFNTMENQFGKSFDTYAGKDAKSRPEITQRIPIEKYPTIEEFKELFYIWLEEYHNTIHHSKDMEKSTPNKMYERYLPQREKADLEEVRYIFMKREQRKVHQQGVTVNELTFSNDALVPYIRQYVNVLIEYDNIQKVIIEDLDGHFICEASANPIYMYGEDLGQYEKLARERKKANRIVKENKPKEKVNIHEEIMQRTAKARSQTGTEEIKTYGDAIVKDITEGNSRTIKNRKVKPEQEESSIKAENISNMLTILTKKKAINN